MRRKKRYRYKQMLSVLLSTVTVWSMSGLSLAAAQENEEAVIASATMGSSETQSTDLENNQTDDSELDKGAEQDPNADVADNQETDVILDSSKSTDKDNEESKEAKDDSKEAKDDSALPIEEKVVEENTEELSSANDIVPAELLVPATPIAHEFEVEDTNIKSNVEYNTDGKENPDIWGGKTVDWYVPGTSDLNKLGDLTVTNVFPKSTLYFPLGKKMSTLLELSNGRFVSLLDLEFDDEDDPFKFDVKKVDELGIIKEIDIITEKKLKGKLERTCYLKISLNDYTDTTECTTTGTVTLKARKDCSDRIHGSDFCEGDKIEFNYSITVSNKLVHNGDNAELGDRICMQPTANETNTLIWGCNRAALEFEATSNPEKFNATLTTRIFDEVYDKYLKPNDNFWCYSFSGCPKIPSTSTATLTLGIPWNDDESHPSISQVHIYKVNGDNTLKDVTNQFTYSKNKAKIEGWSTSTNTPDRYMIANRDLLPPSSGGNSGGHSHHSGGGGGGHSGGGGGGKGGGGGSGASANLVKASTATKNATVSVRTAINTAIKSKVKAATANIPITAGNEISPATVRSVVKAIDAAAKNKGIAVTPQMNISKTSAGKLVSRVSFNPKLFTSKTNIKLGVALDDKSLRKSLTKSYKNKMQMVKFTQKGSFGMPVTVTAKMDLTGMNLQTLRFYNYDSTKRRLTRIAVPNYTIDQLGYLHFTTTMGETVVITDSAFLKK